MSSTQAKRSSGKVWMLAVALTLAVVLLYFSLRGIVWRDVWNVIANAKWRFIGLSILTGTVASVIRAVRWRILLSSRAPVSVSTTFWANCAGYFGNNFLPARAGELV